MNTSNLIRVVAVALVLLLSQQSVFADSKAHRGEDGRDARHWQKQRSDRRADSHRHEQRNDGPEPFYKPYYQPGYVVKPLPRGYSRVIVNAAEYFHFDGFFYRPSRQGYVVVDAPIGAVIASLPRVSRIDRWRGQPYYIVGNTFYRRHPHGYVVVPNPGFGYRR